MRGVNRGVRSSKKGIVHALEARRALCKLLNGLRDPLPRSLFDSRQQPLGFLDRSLYQMHEGDRVDIRYIVR